ncbi:MAG TPA: triose-phosphate isomerase [Candidatus Cloacimonas sp.]|nr:triose-phosphate isomerase [Candidatus Cloacimonas sp.]
MRKIFIAGNWKMNKGLQETKEFLATVIPELNKLKLDKVIPLIAPAYPFLEEALKGSFGSCMQVSAQDVSVHSEGAYTGEVSASMLASLGLKYCIVGHSECRQYHNETDSTVNTKILKLLENHITPLVCIGETLQQREENKTKEVVLGQLSGCLQNIKLVSGKELILAYEPVWAIGTGKTATPFQAQEVHNLIRNWLKSNYSEKVAAELSLLYGGSIKPGNLKELLDCEDIDGGLIGGASLKEEDFLEMVKIGRKSKGQEC